VKGEPGPARSTSSSTCPTPPPARHYVEAEDVRSRRTGGSPRCGPPRSSTTWQRVAGPLRPPATAGRRPHRRGPAPGRVHPPRHHDLSSPCPHRHGPGPERRAQVKASPVTLPASAEVRCGGWPQAPPTRRPAPLLMRCPSRHRLGVRAGPGRPAGRAGPRRPGVAAPTIHPVPHRVPDRRCARRSAPRAAALGGLLDLGRSDPPGWDEGMTGIPS